MNRLFKEYEIGEFFDEMFSAPGVVRSHYQRLARRFSEMADGEFDRKRLLGREVSPKPRDHLHRLQWR